MTAMRYPNTAQTEIRSRLVLRSTTQGANNRLDVENIVSYDRFDGSTVSMIGKPSPNPRRLGGWVMDSLSMPLPRMDTHALNGLPCTGVSCNQQNHMPYYGKTGRWGTFCLRWSSNSTADKKACLYVLRMPSCGSLWGRFCSKLTRVGGKQ